MNASTCIFWGEVYSVHQILQGTVTPPVQRITVQGKELRETWSCLLVPASALGNRRQVGPGWETHSDTGDCELPEVERCISCQAWVVSREWRGSRNGKANPTEEPGEWVSSYQWKLALLPLALDQMPFPILILAGAGSGW